ncbi:hypothetical protein [Streptomyces sp. NBC_01171]|uniref:hypothetical protein n=1 Tax=Streptomyces sp. NBC_01171 TaxID=2903757 RepID=UPI003868BA30|nr:hypothetical protein OG448_00015 [Streptomyces sp. NBC_01171]WST06131.1 hypothetical protein OG448_30550 [Streptomyces sp. NBC_01171]
MKSADGSEHDMTKDEIALLLADAAHGVEIGVAPVETVVRAGRRRRARRRAVTAVTVVVLAGGTGALAVPGLPGPGDSVSPAKSVSADGRLVFEPEITEVAFGTHGRVAWGVTVQVWPAPRDRAEAVVQTKAMKDWGLTPVTSGSPSDLVGKTSYFVTRLSSSSGDVTSRRLVTFDSTSELPRPKGTDIRVLPQPLTKDDGPLRLVIGTVATTAKQVACHWKDGSTTLADLVPHNSALHSTDAVIRPVRSYPTANWFACLAPGSTTYKSAQVTK